MKITFILREYPLDFTLPIALKENRTEENTNAPNLGKQSPEFNEYLLNTWQQRPR